MRVLVDMDGVLAQWDEEYDACLDAIGPEADGIPRRHERESWDLRVDRTPAEKKIIESIMVNPGFYERLEPIPGARAALREMEKKGHDVRIVTAPYISNPTCASDKLNWIAKRYGSHWAQRVILTTDKTLVHGDILIDDKPEIRGSHVPDWTHILFGYYAYNQHATPQTRLTDWRYWEDACRWAIGGRAA